MVQTKKDSLGVFKKFLYKRLILPFIEKTASDSACSNPIFDNQEFIQIMNISKRTAQRWRSKGYVGFYKLGNRIYYDWNDIQILFEENYNCKK
jgi:hypothetical protein